MDFVLVIIFVFSNFFVFANAQAASSAYPRAPCPAVRLQNGKTRIRGRGRSIKFSCYSGFFLVGDKYATCIRGHWDAPIPVCASFNCTTLAGVEHSIVDVRFFGAVLIYYCEPGFKLIGNSEIYCDGKKWNGTAPYCRNSKAVAPLSCDFEKQDLCWWEQDPYHNFDWQWHNFETPSSHIGTGPTSDHTLGPGNDGHYLYIEATGRLVNESARISSPLYNASYTQSGCFSFWYHMFGSTVGSLNVYMKLETENASKIMFTKSGNQGNRWHRGLFQFTPTTSNFQIIIEGVRGSSYVSDIAVDDVAIMQNEECNVKMENRTGTTSSPDEDQVELVNSMQSCRDRCNTNVTLDSNSSGSSDICHCDEECAVYSMCCPDYDEYCVYKELDSSPDTTVAAPAVKTTSLEHGYILINSTDDIDPDVTQGKTVPLNIETPSPTVKVETSTRRHSKKGCIGCDETTSHQGIGNNKNSSRTKTTNFLSILGTCMTVLLATCIFAAIASVFVLYKRKNLKWRKNCTSEHSDDEDVKFLPSDEVLDFNLMRPSQNRGEN